MTQTLRIFAAVFLTVALAFAGDTLTIRDNGKKLKYQINGDEVNVYGHDNEITVTGSSSDFDVYGNGNLITVIGETNDLDVYGEENTIRIQGHIGETDLRGNSNTVFCFTLEDVTFWGSGNVVEYTKGQSPEHKDRGTENSLRFNPPE